MAVVTPANKAEADAAIRITAHLRVHIVAGAMSCLILPFFF
jgi:hypothetical protein